MERAAASEATQLDYHCGECGRLLTDVGALFTSCGHFFCARARPLGAQPCTRLVAGQPGPCEQCGATCNAGVLADKAAGYDEHVRSFVFDNVGANLRNAAAILDVRILRHLSRHGASAAATLRHFAYRRASLRSLRPPAATRMHFRRPPRR